MCRTLSDTDWDAPCSVLGSAVGRLTIPNTRLAASAQEGGCQIGRVVGAHALAQKLASFGEGSPLRHPELIYVGLSNASGGTTPTRGGHEELLLAQDRGRSRGRPCRLEHSLPARCTWRPWRMPPGAHQHDIIE